MGDPQTSIFDRDQAFYEMLATAEEHLTRLQLETAEEHFRTVIDRVRRETVLDGDTLSDRANEGLGFAAGWKSELEAVEAIEKEAPAQAVRSLHGRLPSGDTRPPGFRRALIERLIAMMERHGFFLVDYHVSISDLWLELDRLDEAWRSLARALDASAGQGWSTQVFGRPFARYARAVLASFRSEEGRVRVEHDQSLWSAALAILLDPSVRPEELDGCGEVPELRREHGAYAPAYAVAMQALPHPPPGIPESVTLIDEDHRRAVLIYRVVENLERVWEDVSEREKRMRGLREEHPDLFEIYARRLRTP